MKNLFIYVLFFLMSQSYQSKAQLSLSPIFGIDFSEIIQNPPVIYTWGQIKINNESYSIISPTLGIKLGIPIWNELNITLSSNFSLKNANTNYGDLFNRNHLRFQFLQNSLLLNYLLAEKINIGLGYFYNYSNRFKIRSETGDWTKVNLSYYNQGATFSIGYLWKDWMLNAYYQLGMKHFVSFATPEISRLDNFAMNSIGLNMAYKFEFKIPWYNKRGSKCPKF